MPMVFDDYSHDELQESLADQLAWQGSRQSRRFVATEVHLGCQWGYTDVERDIFETDGCPRADLVSIEKSHASFGIWVWEIKASRNDFQSDMRKEKWRSYLPFCHRLLFAAPKGLIEPDELPEEAWLWEWHSESERWKYRTSGEEREAVHLTHSVWLSLMFAWARETRKTYERLEDEARDERNDLQRAKARVNATFDGIADAIDANADDLRECWPDAVARSHKHGPQVLRKYVANAVRQKLAEQSPE